ncbi:MAG: methionine--tRNA ligase [Candidatus Portnoybacteria bacterium RBG_13_41_18]|uniref:Methionine--tRNA ligase n=1 Tax=Candidatus Portnoybacteria bacterium RBG_13_41_18 TaxID=1801991 RepID=A0A1G2F9I2_9BACT|nr:MAG: methionine--tRNA ligase [Candidatus Portnoybacteria bacterium RBG_13_41_18]
MSKFYITTTLPYVNAEPHIGFAREIIMADVLARYHRLAGDEVFFNTGTDEHGLKVFRKAQELGVDVQKYCDEQAQSYKNLRGLLNLSWNSFIRTTDKNHIKAAQEFWRRCAANGYIAKKKYKIKYCIGCELEKTESEVVGGCCPLHPDTSLEIIEEENYFFEFSKFQEKLLDLYGKNPNFVLPEKKFNEIKKFAEMGLEDFSISRLKDKMPWGIEVPGDPEHVMYVWFDALINYIVAVGWPDDLNKFNAWWPGVQIAGKDNLRQQSAMWQAMLMAAGLSNSRQIFIGGFITLGGQKMSKSLGNVIGPAQMVQKFGVDGTRYLLLTLGGFGEDVDVTLERLAEKYNGDLANGLGNLVSRVIKLNEKFSVKSGQSSHKIEISDELFSELRFKEILDTVNEQVTWANKYIEEKKLWELVKNDPKEAQKILGELIDLVFSVAQTLTPFMPETSEKIKNILNLNKVEGSLFPRISN